MPRTSGWLRGATLTGAWSGALAAGSGLGWCGSLRRRAGGRRGRFTRGGIGLFCRVSWLIDVLQLAGRPGGVGAFAPDVAGEGNPPGEDRSDPVAVAGQERDVDEQPDHPAREARQLHRPGRDDGVTAVDVGRRPEVVVLERLLRLVAVLQALDTVTGVQPALHGYFGDAGQLSQAHHVADH